MVAMAARPDAAAARASAPWAVVTLDANTDDAVQVRLNGRNATWMDQPGDDRERGDLFTYDLMLTDPSGISTLSRVRDITMLEVTKTGSDGWCFTTLDLMINGKSIYSQSFGLGAV